MADFNPQWFSGSAKEQYEALKNSELFDAGGFDFATHEKNIDAYNKASGAKKNYIDSFYEQPNLVNLTQKDKRPSFVKVTNEENLHDGERLKILDALEAGKDYTPQKKGDEGFLWWVMNKVQGSQIDEIKKGYEKALKGLDDSARAEFFKTERERINTKELKELARHISGGAAAYYQGSWDFLGKDAQAANLERKETNELIKKRFDELGIRGYFDLESQKWFVQPKEFIGTSQWLSFEPAKLGGFVEGLKQNAGKTAGAMVGGLATAAVLKKTPLALAVATPMGARAANVLGSAVGSAIGGVADNYFGAKKAGIKNANLTKNIIGDAALGATGEALGLAGVKAIGAGYNAVKKLPLIGFGVRGAAVAGNAVKNWALNSNPSSVIYLQKTLANPAAFEGKEVFKIANSPTAAVEKAIADETTKKPVKKALNLLKDSGVFDLADGVVKNTQKHQENLLNVAARDFTGNYATYVGNAIKGDTKAFGKFKSLANEVTEEFLNSVKNRGSSSDEMAKILLKKQADAKAAYKEGLEEVVSNSVAAPVEAKSLKAQTAEILKDLQGGRTDTFVAEAKEVARTALRHLTQDGGEVSFVKLDGLRQDLNKFYTAAADESTKRFITRFRSEVLNPLIEKSLPQESLARYNTLLKEYGETAGVTNFDEIVKLMSDDSGVKTFKTAVNRILETSQKESGKLAKIQNVLKDGELGKFEETLLNEMIDKFTTTTKGVKTFDSNAMLDKLAEVGFKPRTQQAADFLGQIQNFNTQAGGIFHTAKALGQIPQPSMATNQLTLSPWRGVQTMFAKILSDRIMSSLPQNAVTDTLMPLLRDRAAVLATRKMASAALNKNVVLAKNLKESVLPNLSKSNLVLTKFKTPDLTPLRKLAHRINTTTNLAKRGGFYAFTNGEGLSNGDYARRRAAFAELEENGR